MIEVRQEQTKIGVRGRTSSDVQIIDDFATNRCLICGLAITAGEHDCSAGGAADAIPGLRQGRAEETRRPASWTEWARWSLHVAAASEAGS